MIVLRGVEQALAALEQKNTRMRAASRAALSKALHLLEQRTKQKLTTSSHPPNTPTPAAPGEPPSLVTGNLRRSITVTGPTQMAPGRWRGQVGPTAVYGRIQELGGPTVRGILPPRPYLRPSYEEVRPQIAALFRAAWTTAILK